MKEVFLFHICTFLGGNIDESILNAFFSWFFFFPILFFFFLFFNLECFYISAKNEPIANNIQTTF